MTKEAKLQARIKRLEEALFPFASLVLCAHEDETKPNPDYSCEEICETDNVVMWVYAGKPMSDDFDFTREDIMKARKLLKLK